MDLYQIAESWTDFDFPQVRAAVEIDQEIVSRTDAYGNYLTHVLVDLKRFDLLIDLYRLQGHVIGLYQNNTQKTVLHLLARLKHADVFETVAACCPQALAVPDNCGRLPMHVLLMHDTLFLACKVMVRWGQVFDVRLEDKEGVSVLKLFDQKFFDLQTMCWEFGIKGEEAEYQVLFQTGKILLDILKSEKNQARFQNLSDILIMKELKISVLHEAAITAPLPVLEAFSKSPGLSTFCDMSGMCPLMKLISSPNPDFSRVQVLLNVPFESFDRNNRSLLHHVLMNRRTDAHWKEAVFSLICDQLSQEKLTKMMEAVDSTGHTILTLAIGEMREDFVMRVLRTYMTIFPSWEGLYGKEAWNKYKSIENPLIAGMKTARIPVIKALLDSGFHVFQEPHGQSSVLFTLIRLYDASVLLTFIDFCGLKKSEIEAELTRYLTNELDRKTKLSPAIDPVLTTLTTGEYSPFSLLIYGFAVETISLSETILPPVVIEYLRSADPEYDLLRFALFTLLSYGQFNSAKDLTRIPQFAHVFQSRKSANFLPVKLVCNICQHCPSLTQELLTMSFIVSFDGENLNPLERFLHDVVLTRGKSYSHIIALFSLIDHASKPVLHDVESILARERTVSTIITYDLIVFFTNVLRHYHAYNPIWINVLLAIFREEYIRGFKLILNVLVALCQDGMVRLPMKLMDRFCQTAVETVGDAMPRCSQCQKPTSEEDGVVGKVSGIRSVAISDQRIELFFLLSALERTEAQVAELFSAYSGTSLRELVDTLVKQLRWNAGNKLYTNRPYVYMDFVREWFQTLPLCTCYVGTISRTPGDGPNTRSLSMPLSV